MAMGQVNISVNGRVYDIACDDGQEEHIKRLGAYLDGKVGELVTSVGQVGDARLLVMASLLVADELAEVYGELAEARDGLAQGEAATAAQGAAVLAAEESLAQTIESLAQRVEDIAAQMEGA